MKFSKLEGAEQLRKTISAPTSARRRRAARHLCALLHALYGQARFDLRLDYSQPPVPPLGDEDAAWAGELVGRLH